MQRLEKPLLVRPGLFVSLHPFRKRTYMADNIITGLELRGNVGNLLSSLRSAIGQVKILNAQLAALKKNSRITVTVNVAGTGGQNSLNNLRQLLNGLSRIGRNTQQASQNITTLSNSLRQAAQQMATATRQLRNLNAQAGQTGNQTRQAGRNVSGLTAQVRALNAAIGTSTGRSSFAQKFATAFGIGAGATTILTVIRQTREAIKDLIESSGEFQKLESSFVSILAQAQQNASGNRPISAADLEAIRGESVRIFREAQIAAIQTVATTKEYVEVLQAALAVGQQVGLSQEQTEKITKRLVLAAGAFGVEQSSVATSVSQILAGTVRVTNQLGRSLGLTTKEQREQLKLAIQQGRLFEFLEQKTRAFGQTAKEVSNNFINVRSAVQDIFEVGGAEAIQPLFKFLNDELIKFRDRFISDNPLQPLRPALKDVIAQTQNFLSSILPNLKTLFNEVKTLFSEVGRSITGQGGIGGVKILLNLFTGVLRLVRSIVSGSALGKTLFILGASVALLRSLSTLLRTAVAQSQAFAENMRQAALAGGAVGRAITTATIAGAITKGLGLLGVAIAGVSILWNAFSDDAQEAAKALDTVTVAADRLEERFNKQAETFSFTKLLSDFRELSNIPVDQRSEDQLKRLAEVSNELSNAFSAAGKSFDEATARILASGRVTQEVLDALIARSHALEGSLGTQIDKTNQFISVLEQLKEVGTESATIGGFAAAGGSRGFGNTTAADKVISLRAKLTEQAKQLGKELGKETDAILKNAEAMDEEIRRSKSLNELRELTRQRLIQERQGLEETLETAAKLQRQIAERQALVKQGIADSVESARIEREINDLQSQQAVILEGVITQAKLKGQIKGESARQILEAEKAELESILKLNAGTATNIVLARQAVQARIDLAESERDAAIAFGDSSKVIEKQNEILALNQLLKGSSDEELKKSLEARVAIINTALASIRTGSPSGGTGRRGGSGRQRDELRDFIAEIDRQRALLNSVSDLLEKDADRIEEQKRRAIRELGQVGALPFEDALSREEQIIRRANAIRQNLNEAQRNFIKSNNELIRAVAERQEARDNKKDKQGTDLRDRRIEALEREHKANLESLKKITDDARKFEDQLTELTRFGVEQRIDLRRREVEFQREFTRLQADSTNRVKQAQAQLGIISTEDAIQAEFEAGKADREARRKALLFELAPLADPKFAADLKAANKKFGTTATGETLFEIIDKQTEVSFAALEEDLKRAEEVSRNIKALNELLAEPVKTRSKADANELVKRRDELEQKLRELNESIASRAGGTLTPQQVQAATTVITLLTTLGVSRQEQIAKIAELLAVEKEEAEAILDRTLKLRDLDIERLELQKSLVEFDSNRLDLLEQIIERQKEFGQISELDARRAQFAILQQRIQLQELLRQKLQQDLQTRFSANVNAQSSPTQFAQRLEVAGQLNEVSARLFELKNRAFELRSPLVAAADGFRTVGEAIGAIEGPIGSLRNVFSGLASLVDVLANRQRPRTAGEDIREAAKAVEGSGIRFKDIVGEASVLWKNTINQTAEVMGSVSELFRKLINDFRTSGASGGGELPLSGLSAGSLLGSLGFDSSPTPAAANDLKKTGTDLKLKIASLIGNIASSAVDLLQSITSGDVGSIVSSVGRTIGTFGGPIGKAIGAVVEIAGGVISFFGARARQKTKEMAEEIDKGISELKDKISSGAIGLGQGIAQLRAELESARRRLSNRKGGQDELKRIEEETQAEIERLRQQARDIQKNFREQLDLLRTPLPLRDLQRQIRDIAKQAKEFIKSFENSNDALAAIEEAQEFVRRSIQELKDEVEKNLRDLQQDLKEATEDFNQSRQDILRRGRLDPQVSEAEQKQRELNELAQNFRRQRQQLNEQISAEEQKLKFVESRFKIEEKIAKLATKSASQLGLAADKLLNVSLAAERAFANINRFPFTAPQPIYLASGGGTTGPMNFIFKFADHELVKRQPGIPARRHLNIAGRISGNRASKYRPIGRY